MVLLGNNHDIHVGIGEYKIAGRGQRLVTLGLGSCVGISLWDPVVKVGGLLHVMLPNSKEFTKVDKPGKFADLGIPLLIEDLQKRGAQRSRMQAKLVGGAQMFSGADRKQLFNIGERNIKMSRQTLKEMSIKILGENVGGNKGRTMYLVIDSGEVLVRMIGHNIEVM